MENNICATSEEVVNFAGPLYTVQKGFRNPFAKQLFDFKADRDWSISPIENMKQFTGNIEGQEKRLSATGLDKREYMGWDRMRLCM